MILYLIRVNITFIGCISLGIWELIYNFTVELLISLQMVKVKITVDPHVAEYINGKFFNSEAGTVQFPTSLDIYVLI